MSEHLEITTLELDRLEATKSSVEWNAVCDEIKLARGGQYPPNWWPRVMQSGLAARVQEGWKVNS